MEEDIIREAPVVPTGGQAGRWQAIADTTTIGSSLVDLKEKGATPQDRRFLYVDCIKRTTAALGCRGRNNRTRPPPAEPPRNVLRRTSQTGGECRFEARCYIVSRMSVANCFIMRMTGADKRRRARRQHNNNSTVVYTYLP